MGHSITNWKRQISIEMISNTKEPYIFCWDIQIPTEIDSSVLKWLQRWQNVTFFVGTFKFNWKRQFSIEMISKMTDPNILCGDIQIQLKKTIQYRKDLKDHKTLHSLWGHSKPNWKRQFIIDMITKMTEHYIVCGDIQLPTEKDSSVLKWLQRWQNITIFVGTLKLRLKKTV